MTTLPSDEELAVLIARRDQEAFLQIYDRYARVVYSLAAHTLGNAEADEITQDVFMRLWEHAGQYDPARGLFAAWFMTIARNRVRDALRQRSQHLRFIAAQEIYDLLENTPESWDRVVENRSVSLDLTRRLVAALHDLPAEQRQVIILAYFGDLSQSALAEELQWPLGTVKKRIRLGLQKLRARLTGQALAETEPISAEADEHESM